MLWMCIVLELRIRWEEHIPAICGETGTMTVTHQSNRDKRFILGQNQGWTLEFHRKGGNKGPGHQTSREGSPESDMTRLAGLSLNLGFMIPLEIPLVSES